MSVLLAVNETLLRETVPTDEEAQVIVEKVVDFFEKYDGLFEASTDLGVDPEARPRCRLPAPPLETRFMKKL